MTREQALLEMQELVIGQKKDLRIDIEYSPSESSQITFEVDNYSDECIPLPGWDWEDPNTDTRQPTLEYAWGAFKEGMSRKQVPNA